MTINQNENLCNKLHHRANRKNVAATEEWEVDDEARVGKYEEASYLMEVATKVQCN